MTPTLWRAGRRQATRHPGQTALAVLGVALGVAVVTAIDLTRESATRSFERATDAVVGRTTHRVVGGPAGLDEGVYATLRRSLPLPAAAPVIEANLPLADRPGRSLRLLGVDPIAEAPLRGYWSGPGTEGGPDLAPLMTRHDTALVSRAAADRLGLAPGAALAVRVGGRVETLTVLDLLEATDRAPALAGVELAVVDIATAQELLGMTGRLSRIDLVLEEAGQAEAVRALIGPGAGLVRAEARTEALSRMTRAFHGNLAALSLLALLVGMFLIYNAQTFTVLQRRAQFGVLRALGLRRRQLAALVLGEAAILAAVGSAAGLLLGVVLAGGLIGLVTRTINDLYYPLSMGGVTLSAASLAKGAALGLGASLVAALVPAREAARVEPREALSRAELEGRAGRGARAALRVALVLAAASLVVFLLPLRSVAVGLTGLFLMVLAAALVAPAATVALSRAVTGPRWIRRRLVPRLAARGVDAALSRTGVAVAALMLAVAHTVGIGLMVASFRHSVADWLSTALRADYYVSVPDAPAAGGHPSVTVGLLGALAQVPGVEGISHIREATLESASGPVPLVVYGLNEAAREGFRFRANPEGAAVWRRFEAEDAVLVSEPYAYHHALAPGDALRLRTAAGPRDFAVLAVYQDYGSDRGRIAMSRVVYDRHWQDPGVDGIGVYAGAGFERAAFERRLLDLAGPEAGLELIDSGAILAESLRVFDRTFTITEVLRLLAGIIAFVGVFGALMAIQLERVRELGVLRAVGATRGQIRAVVLGETALIGAAAGLLAVPTGLLMATLLVEVVNRRSFGWTMDLQPDPGILAGGVVLALAAALLAGVYPALRMARVRPAEALRQE